VIFGGKFMDNIKAMKIRRERELLNFINTNVTAGDINKATRLMLESKTYACLQDVEEEFYWKSYEDIINLFKAEYDEDWKTWENIAE